MAHLDPLPREELPQYEALFECYDRIRGFLPNSILTMGRRPKITDAFMQLNQAVLYEGTELEAPPAKVAERAIGLIGWDAGKHAG